MDYNRPLSTSNDPPTVDIALVLLPGQNSTQAQTESKPPLLINPGGPGGSGVMVTLILGSSIQKIAGADQPIIGFDPRGVGFTTPRADCWTKPPDHDATSGLLRRLEWDNVNSAFGLFNSSNVAAKFLDAGHRAVNELCRSKDAQLGSSSILGHATTVHVVQDMVSIVDAWDRWIENRGLLPNSLKGKLVYWGFSYGTYLGATFAKMFPDRVGRLVLDGVVDADEYTTFAFADSLTDTEKVLDQFFYYCVKAKTRCALYRAGDDPSRVKRRYNDIMERLEASLVTFTHPEHFIPVVLRAELFKTIAFSVLYSPIQGFPTLAVLLDFIHKGQYDVLAPLFPNAQIACSSSMGPLLAAQLSDAQRAIMCSDKTHSVSPLALKYFPTSY
jgi:pimeloyl-ACP methyl ester carboxylesterase